MDIDEKRVYADRAGDRTVYLVGDGGVVRVAVAGDRVGRFGLVAREPTHAVAVGRDGAHARLALAGADVRSVTIVDGSVTATTATGFGRATAVGAHPRPAAAAEESVALLAGDADRLARYAAPTDTWATIGPGPVRAIDGPLAATDDGVYRWPTDEWVFEGAAVDVCAGLGLVATQEGVVTLSGESRLATGPVQAVAGTAAWTVALTAEALLVRRDGDDWHRTAAADAVAVGVADVPVVATAAGAVWLWSSDVGAADAPDGSAGDWRSRALGLTDVATLAVLPES